MTRLTALMTPPPIGVEIGTKSGIEQCSMYVSRYRYIPVVIINTICKSRYSTLLNGFDAVLGRYGPLSFGSSKIVSSVNFLI